MIFISELVTLIKQAASDQINSTNPTAVMIGVVTSVDPLKIKLDQKLTITESFLIMTKSVMDYTTNMTVDHVTESYSHSHQDSDNSSSYIPTDTHNHGYSGTKSFTIHNSLKLGDSVLLLRVQGGNKFVVLDVIGGEDV